MLISELAASAYAIGTVKLKRNGRSTLGITDLGVVTGFIRIGRAAVTAVRGAKAHRISDACSITRICPRVLRESGTKKQ